MEKDKWGHKTWHPLFLWQTTSTTLQLVIDHAFTGSYARRFLWTLPHHYGALVDFPSITLTISLGIATFTTYTALVAKSPHVAKLCHSIILFTLG
jgi:hypothetical protein